MRVFVGTVLAASLLANGAFAQAIGSQNNIVAPPVSTTTTTTTTTTTG